ncbi:MAG: GtrA family protein [Clostridiales bacterium]|jgi:putative flippase GtrA|nr:GtrA family protein [Clostridiales bacterium]
MRERANKLIQTLEEGKFGPLIKKVINREFITYIICGVLTSIVGISTYSLFRSMSLNVPVSNTFSSAIAIAFAFVVNKQFVFESKDWSFPFIAYELGRFAGGRVFTYLVETGLLMLMVDKLHLYEPYCKLFSQAVIIALNYIISKWIIFKKNS